MDTVEEYAKILETHFGPEFKGTPLYEEFLQLYKADYDATVAAGDPGNWHVKASPLLDVLCVSVHGQEFDDSERPRPFEICGTIQLIADEKYAYFVYDRKSDNPETVSPGGNLSLTRPDGTPRHLFLPFVSSFKMHVHLRDAARDKDVANGDFDLELMDTVVVGYGNIKTQHVQGHDGFATIQYVTVPNAVIANVELSLLKEDGNGSASDSHAEIYGTISAASDDNISTLLFKKAPCEPIMVDFNTPLRLSRPALAVPAYSSLQIKADLWDHHTKHQIATDLLVAHCQAQDYKPSFEHDCILGHNYRVRVKIDGKHAYIQLFKKGFSVHKPKPLQRTSKDLRKRGTRFYMDELLIAPARASSRYIFGSTLVELFSISIGNVNSPIFGKIQVEDAKGSLCILQRDCSSKKKVVIRDTKMDLEWPCRSFTGTYFGVKVHLTDDKGDEFCKGYFYWGIPSIDYPITWYNRRISSVIRGERGYATVNYTMFHNALQATVKVVLLPYTFSDVPFKVGGNIVARYDSYTYSSFCERHFFQTTLLADHNCYTVLARGSPLMLQKSVVSVPWNSNLVLRLNLQAQPIKEIDNAQHCIQTLQGERKLQINVNGTSFRMFKGNGFHAIVFVEWSTIKL